MKCNQKCPFFEPVRSTCGIDCQEMAWSYHTVKRGDDCTASVTLLKKEVKEAEKFVKMVNEELERRKK